MSVQACESTPGHTCARVWHEATPPFHVSLPGLLSLPSPNRDVGSLLISENTREDSNANV